MAVAVAKVLAERRTDKNNVSSLMTRKTVSRTLSYNAYACFLHGCVPNTLVTITFTEQGNKTLLSFRQGVFESVPSRDAHEEGWSSAFELLAESLAKH